MLLQTNSYIVPKEKRAEHARLMRRFRQILNRIGCDNFEVYEQVGANWSNTSTAGRFVQIMRFRDRRHQLSVQNAERTDPAAQELIAEFCELINYPVQQQQGQFAVGFYSSVLPVAPLRVPRGGAETEEAASDEMAEVQIDPPAPDAASHEESVEADLIDSDFATPEEGHEQAPVEGAVNGEAKAEATGEQDALSGDDLAEDVFAGDELNSEPAEHGSADDVHTDEAAPTAEAAATPEEGSEGGFDHGLSEEELSDEALSMEAEESPGGAAAHPGEDDDISRLAEELSAGETDGKGQRRGKASENGAH